MTNPQDHHIHNLNAAHLIYGDSSRTLEQRIEAAQAAFNGGVRKSLEAAGLPDLLAERDALLERVKHAEQMSGLACLPGCEDCPARKKALAERDAAQAAAREMARTLADIASLHRIVQILAAPDWAKATLNLHPGFLEEGT